MEEWKLYDAEYRLMEIVWEKEPLSSTELYKACLPRLGWKKSTTYTVIRKLSERGFLQNEDSVVRALVSKGECQAEESDYFVERTFGGSLPKFLTAFLGNRKISEQEAEELKRLIDSHREV